MPTINVDFEVFKALTARRRSETMTENEVIRELLDLSKPEDSSETVAQAHNISSSWVSKGVVFPHGTEFRVNYKGQMHTGIVQNGALVLNGKRFSSPSAAATELTGGPVNGWVFWECLLPGTTKWKKLALLRK
ncbi:MAG: restriction system modified-DNA reader domain-containing protein [Methylobacter sp.]